MPSAVNHADRKLITMSTLKYASIIRSQTKRTGHSLMVQYDKCCRKANWYLVGGKEIRSVYAIVHVCELEFNVCM